MSFLQYKWKYGKARQLQQRSKPRWVSSFSVSNKGVKSPIEENTTLQSVCDYYCPRSVTLHHGGCVVSLNIFIHTSKHHWFHPVLCITTNHMAISPSFQLLICRMSFSLGKAELLIPLSLCMAFWITTLLEESLQSVLKVTAVYAEEDSSCYSGSVACLDEEFFDVVFWDYHRGVMLIRAGMTVPLQNLI